MDESDKSDKSVSIGKVAMRESFVLAYICWKICQERLMLDQCLFPHSFAAVDEINTLAWIDQKQREKQFSGFERQSVRRQSRFSEWKSVEYVS
jgi:hypothetical protein